MTAKITLQLDFTTNTTGNASQVAKLIGASAWHISGDYLVVENPLLDYRVTDNEAYCGKLDRIPNGADVVLVQEAKTLRQQIDQLLTTRIPILDQIYDVCQAIEKCGASPELTDAVTKASALREPISELVKQALALGIGEGIVAVSHSNETKVDVDLAELPEYKVANNLLINEPSCSGSVGSSSSKRDERLDNCENTYMLTQLLSIPALSIELKTKVESKLSKLVDKIN